MTSSKKALGQFMTKRYAYILQGMEVPQSAFHIIEPFVGAGDLLGFLPENKNFDIECYDIAPAYSKATQRDTLANPPEFFGKFVITNPPYLAKNKANDKTIFARYGENDLYKCFLRIIIKDPPCGGMIIVPVNFWSSTRPRDIALRRDFLRTFEISRVNIFEEQVFADTSYSICAIQFAIWGDATPMSPKVSMQFFPSKDTLEVSLCPHNDWSIGGEIYKLGADGFKKYNIGRLTKKNAKEVSATNLLVKCIDDNKGNLIKMSFVSPSDVYVDRTKNLSARSYMSLSIEPPIGEARQKRLAQDFNEWLAGARQRYRSLFLANYRDSTNIARKRISFELIYRLVAHLLESPSKKEED